MKKCEVLVIGGGPGGYAAAIRASQLGKKTLLVEKEHFGGVCLNRGCIPTKVFLQTAGLLQHIKQGNMGGIKIKAYEFDRTALLARKAIVVDSLVAGVKGLLDANGVETLQGEAFFLNDKSVVVNGEENVQAENIIIATGSTNMQLSFPGANLPDILDSDGALSLEKIPKSIAIIGGGVLGIEFAEIYNAFGSKVYILEALPCLLPREDTEVSEFIRQGFERKGIDVFTSAAVRGIEDQNPNKEVIFVKDGSEGSILVEQVLIAVGRKPNVAGLGLKNTAIMYDQKGIQVNHNFETNVKGVYAVGDVNGGMQLAHVAYYEGEKAVENIAGAKEELDFKAVPRCIFCLPEIAAVGLTEQEVKEKGCNYQLGKFPLLANGKAILMEEATGFIKIITDTRFKEILGVSIVGPSAGELIAAATLAINLECTVEEIIATIHAHPTIGESFREAAMDVLGRSIHFKV